MHNTTHKKYTRMSNTYICWYIIHVRHTCNFSSKRSTSPAWCGCACDVDELSSCTSFHAARSSTRSFCTNVNCRVLPATSACMCGVTQLSLYTSSDTYMCTHTCVCMCVCVCTLVCVRECVCTHTRTHAHTHTQQLANIHIQVHVSRELAET